jgi:hypothetical protein
MLRDDILAPMPSPSHPERTAARVLAAALAAAALTALPACRGGGAAIDYARPMPAGLDQAEVLDVQLFRDVTRVELTNTTARSFENATIWLNERWSRPIERLGIGESLELSLWEFVDEYGEPFRAGGFFATRDPDAVVLAQLEADGSLFGLVIGGNRIK